MKNTFNHNYERDFLNSLVSDYKDVSPYSQCKKEIIFEMIKFYFIDSNNKTGLQLGCSNGYETSILSKHLRFLDVVDGSSVFIDRLKNNNEYSNVNFIYSLFEEYKLTGDEKKYDYVFCNYVLEHVYEVPTILQMIQSVIKKEGLFFVVVPNANAFSRQLALQMGLIKDLKALTENDVRHGHRRIYDTESLLSDITNAGFEILDCKGIIFKILADFQLNKLLQQNFLSNGHIIGLNGLGAKYPVFSDSIFVVAKLSYSSDSELKVSPLSR